MIPIMADNIFEGIETFDIMLELPSLISKGITLGSKNKAKVTIIDSTSELYEFVEQNKSRVVIFIQILK